jgi:hypothetical protein
VITFASLFLGLVLGTVNVELAAAPEVVTIQLLLDGRQVAELRPPWKATIDLGRELAPHELVAVGRDANGNEIGQARQRINLPRPVAEAGFVLEPGKGGKGRMARLVWRSLERESPISVVVTFDGKVLPAPRPERIELPNYSPMQPHFLHADLDFGGDVSATAEMVFGGSRMTESSTTLTAIPVLLEKGQRAPTLKSLDGKLIAGGEPVRVAAIEKGLAEVVFVLAGRAMGELSQMRGMARRWESRLGPGERFRFLMTVPVLRTINDGPMSLFPTTKEFSRWDGSVLEMEASIKPGVLQGEQIAPAVAVAALTASARNRRRAVVLLIGPEAIETSDLPAAAARRFLERLRVPLFVWSLEPDQSPVLAGFSGTIDTSTHSRFDRAVSVLSHFLDQQRIVWVEGRHLPQAISLSPKARDVTLVD